MRDAILEKMKEIKYRQAELNQMLWSKLSEPLRTWITELEIKIQKGVFVNNEANVALLLSSRFNTMDCLSYSPLHDEVIWKMTTLGQRVTFELHSDGRLFIQIPGGTNKPILLNLQLVENDGALSIDMSSATVPNYDVNSFNVLYNRHHYDTWQLIITHVVRPLCQTGAWSFPAPFKNNNVNLPDHVDKEPLVVWEKDAEVFKKKVSSYQYDLLEGRVWNPHDYIVFNNSRESMEAYPVNEIG